MIEVTGVTLREIRLPLREPFRFASGVAAERRIALLEVRERSGVVAWSECVALDQPGYSSETIDTAWLAVTAWLAPRLLGYAVATARDVRPLLDRGVRGHSMAKAALEMAVWAIEAELSGLPLARHLGGTRSEVEAGISLGIQASTRALVLEAESAVARGYRRIKLKIHPGADVEVARAVRRALGPLAPLSVDANAAYTLDAVDALRELDELGLGMIEQPLAHDDLVRHAELQRRLKTPICLDESITSLARAEDMVALGSARIVNVKPGRVGGFAESLRIHDFCASRGVPLWCGGMFESGIGRAYNVALASLPHFTLPGDLSPSARYWERDVVEPEWTMSPAGTLRVPLERPGLGVAVDRERIDALTAKKQELVSPNHG